jgi:hypothetical protein
MELNEIKILLEKFYEGLTSLEEERILRDYFRNQSVPEELISDKDLFLFTDSEKEIVPSSQNLERKLENWIDHQGRSIKRNKYVQLGYTVASIAAGLAILVVCYLFISKEGNKNKIKDTYSDPQLAYAEVQRTLLYISEKLNKGTKPLTNVGKLNQGMKEFSSFSSFGSGLKQLELVSKYYDQPNNEKQ